MRPRLAVPLGLAAFLVLAGTVAAQVTPSLPWSEHGAASSRAGAQGSSDVATTVFDPPSPSPSASPTPPPEPTPIPADRLQRVLDVLRERYRIPGIAATIEWPDGRTWTGVSGLANVKSATPVTPDTAFAVGSVSKTFTAALILDLADEGRLTLDDRVRDWLPDAKASTAVTIRMLLDHTSGIHDYFLNPKIDAALMAKRGKAWTPQQALRYVRSPYFRPGRGWQYSNTNYVLLGLIAEKATGRPLAVELRERFLDPLGLTSTIVQGAEPARGPVAHGYRVSASKTAKPVDLSDGSDIAPFTSVVTAAGAAGAIATSSSDLAHWAMALYGGAALSPERSAEMVGDVARTRALRARIPYGLGVQAVRVDGRPTYGHSGRLLGARAVMRYLINEGAAIAVVTNQSRYDPAYVAKRLLYVAFPPPPPSPALAAEGPASSPAASLAPSAPPAPSASPAPAAAQP
jgi:D-alanyl-D-alanine carboxypeptidase